VVVRAHIDRVIGSHKPTFPSSYLQMKAKRHRVHRNSVPRAVIRGVFLIALRAKSRSLSRAPRYPDWCTELRTTPRQGWSKSVRIAPPRYAFDEVPGKNAVVADTFRRWMSLQLRGPHGFRYRDGFDVERCASQR
jgi:hypothetical protein